MSKYTCDATALTSAADALNNQADTLLADLASYQSEVDSLLSTWSGETKEKFKFATSEDIGTLTTKIKEVQLFTVYLKELINGIDQIETELTKTEL